MYAPTYREMPQRCGCRAWRLRERAQVSTKADIAT
jgi:hypothetical protein